MKSLTILKLKKMELMAIDNQVVKSNQVEGVSNKNRFIEANTKKVSINHLKNECIIPVFAKDNETTISHYEFVNSAFEVIKELLPDAFVETPDIRVSHTIKGRIPSAIGKPAKDLLEHEKTLYYERMAFMIPVPGMQVNVNSNLLDLTVGGVRSFNQENLFSKKSIEKFKIFIGYKNTVCTNLCIATDGLQNEVRVSSVLELKEAIYNLISNFNRQAQLGNMERMSKYSLSENQFAHLIGKMKMFPHLNKSNQELIQPLLVNDSHVSAIVKGYFQDPNFKRSEQGDINLWNLYNLFTGAVKNSYIDSHLEKNVGAYELIQILANSIEYGHDCWYLQI